MICLDRTLEVTLRIQKSAQCYAATNFDGVHNCTIFEMIILFNENDKHGSFMEFEL